MEREEVRAYDNACCKLRDMRFAAYEFYARQHALTAKWALCAGYSLVCTGGLVESICDMDKTATRILSAHTPRYLQAQTAGIAAMDKFVNAGCTPAAIRIDRHVLDTSWHPLEMPAVYVVLSK